MSAINQFWDWITGTNKQGPQAAPSIIPFDYSALYQALYDLYNNDDAIATDDTTRRLRTVVNRSVEFYAAKVLPGKVTPIAEDNPELEAALERILKQSSFQNQKPAMIRGFALYGDSFVRIRGDQAGTYLEDLSPFYVTDFGENSIGRLTYIRIDIAVLDDENQPALYTEYWEQEAQRYRSWLTRLSVTTPISQLGTPQEDVPLSAYGVTVIPIVHTKFRDIGDPRGLGCVYHALDKIYEANRVATRLHDLFFRFDKPIFVASAKDKDASGRPLPAPRIDATATGEASSAEKGKEAVFGDIVSLPGLAELAALIPNLNYADGLAILNALMAEIETDLPELRWYSIKEGAGLSGKAIRDLLGAAVDRAIEAKDNFIASLELMLEIALTIAIFNGLEDGALGTMGAGDFDHELRTDDAWGATIDDKAATMKALTEAGIPAPAAMELAAFTAEEIDKAFPNGSEPAPAKMPVTPGTPVKGAAPNSAVRVA